MFRSIGMTASAAGFAAVLLLSLASGSSAQNQKNAKKPVASDNQSSLGMPSLPLSDAQSIEQMVSQMLGAWQVGDVDAMHKYYSDDVAVVSGAWEPPLIGWSSYARAYQAQRARSQGSRIERTNTFTKVTGDTAWCTYQWEFIGQVDGQVMNVFGHTTLVLEKRAGNWVIVLNHTSTAGDGEQSTAAAQPANSVAR